jgi:hypothetical protein
MIDNVEQQVRETVPITAAPFQGKTAMAWGSDASPFADDRPAGTRRAQ